MGARGRTTVAVGVGLTALLAAGVSGTQARTAPRGTLAAQATGAIKPTVRQAVRFDVSPPLRSMTIVPPRDRGGLEEREGKGPGTSNDVQTPDPVVQSSFGSTPVPGTLANFEGIRNLANVSPPDPVGDVGPSHYVEMVNLSFAVFTKTGQIVFGPADLGTLWQGFLQDCQDESGDPIVLYDQLADRWILTQFTTAGPEFFNCVAVSTSGDPTGSYFRYAFSTGTNFPDYPKYGVWPDAYYASTREFGAVDFAGIGVYALERKELLKGNPAARVVSFLVPPGNTPYVTGDGLLPADLDGSALPPKGSPEYFAGTMDDGAQYHAPQDAINLFEFRVNWARPATSTFAQTATLPVAPFDSIFSCGGASGRECIPQPGTGNRIDILSYRQRPIWRLAYRNFGTHESLVTNQSVEARHKIAGVRWYEIRSPGASPVVYQQGTYAPDDGVNRWMGSVAMDRRGDMAAGFSVSNDKTVFPGIRYTGRPAGAPLGSMTLGEGVVVNGTGSQLISARWGDYTSMNVDPVDDCTFWYVNEYYAVSSARGWQTRIASFRLPGC